MPTTIKSILTATPEEILAEYGHANPLRSDGVTYGQLKQWTFYIGQDDVELFLRDEIFGKKSLNGEIPFTITRDAAVRVMFAIVAESADDLLIELLEPFENKDE